MSKGFFFLESEREKIKSEIIEKYEYAFENEISPYPLPEEDIYFSMINYLISKGYGNYKEVCNMNELVFWKAVSINNREQKISNDKLKND